MEHTVFVLADHPWQEHLFWWAQSLLLIAVVAGAWIAFVQLRVVANQARATLLLELDRRFEGEQLATVRRKLHGIRDSAVNAVGQAHPRAGDGERGQHIRAECLRVINGIRQADPDEYSKLMSYMGFFETVGLMIERGYVSIEEIDELFRGPILAIDLHFRDHVVERGRETGVPDGLYKHALNLADQVRSRATTQ